MTFTITTEFADERLCSESITKTSAILLSSVLTISDIDKSLNKLRFQIDFKSEAYHSNRTRVLRNKKKNSSERLDVHY